MFTQCPNCSTHFSISDQDLTAAGGKVQCGKCDQIFNALYTLSKHPLSVSDCDAAEIVEISSIDHLGHDGVAESYQLNEPHENSPAAPPTNTSTLTLGIIGLLLCALLFVQTSYFTSDKLAQSYPVLRPWLEQFCAVTQCRLSLQHAPDKITIINRDLRDHPTIPGALLINLTLKNGASFTQPYPLLKLSFFDINHKLLASRTFQPREYLPQAVEIDDGFPAGRPLSITLELIAPDKQAVNFEFEFK